MGCPKTCQDNIDTLHSKVNKVSRNFPAWARALLVVLLGVAFAGIATSFMYGTKIYAEKEDLATVKADLKEDDKELRLELKELSTLQREQHQEQMSVSMRILGRLERDDE